MFAGAIENGLLVAQSTEHLVIRFQVTAELLDTAMVGLVGIDADGRFAWENAAERSLLCGSAVVGHHVDRVPDCQLGWPWPQLASLPATGAAPLPLPNGLLVWARAEMRAPDGHRRLVPGWSPQVVDTAEISVTPMQATAPVPLLRDSDLALIHRTLQACHGNVSDAARQLGVSRGLIYRRLRAAGQPGEAASA